MASEGYSAIIRPPHLTSLLWASRRPNYRSAWHGHVSFVHWLVGVSNPRIIVELGVEHGVSYAAMCHAVAALGLPTKCYGIDTWEGDTHTGVYDESVYVDLKTFNDRHYSGFSTLLRCRFDDAVGRFGDGTIDVLHIDGLHTYEAVRHDFETWLPKMSDRGLVLLHDTAIRNPGFGVWQLWGELQRRYPSFGFEHSAGLGLVAVGASAPGPVAALCRLSDVQEIATMRETFQAFSEAAHQNGFHVAQLSALQASLDALRGEMRRAAADLTTAAGR
jgi:hypothetical protein